jgi:hypothetical protein
MITWLLRQRPNLPAKRLSRFGCLDSRRDNRTPLSLLIPQRDMMRTCVREFRPTSLQSPPVPLAHTVDKSYFNQISTSTTLVLEHVDRDTMTLH